MSSKSIYGIGIEISGMQRVLESMSPVLKSVHMLNAAAAAMSTSIINQQLFIAAQPIREATERWNQIFNTVEMNALRESLKSTSELMGSSSVNEATNNLQRVLKSASLQMNLSSAVQLLNLGINPQIMETFRKLAVDTSFIEKSIQNNLRVFRDVDWSELINPDDLDDLDFENSLDGAVIDINGGITFQQRLVEFANKLKSKYPVIFTVFIILIYSPMQSAIDDAILSAIKGITTPIIEQAQTTDYKVIEKNIRIEVNNTLNINVASKNARDELLKIYGYVSTDKLIMRKTNKVKSKALHTLEFGQVVRIIHKDRNWTLVEYESEGDPIQGWVFTRYISKFKK